MDLISRAKGCLIGLAIGDAVGTTVEFSSRGSFKPVTDMSGGGPFKLQAGQWTDDTSMALCLAESLAEMKTFDARDQLERYLKWYRTGYLSSTGICFDIGGITSQSLISFETTGRLESAKNGEYDAANGSLMRLAAVPIFYSNDIEKAMHYSAASSATTHSATECLDGCRLFGGMLVKALRGVEKQQILLQDQPFETMSAGLKNINEGSYMKKPMDEIVGSGYVVRSLEAALWCFYQTENYRDAILLATNLGDDADTTAAICGQLAGAYYGLEGIPTEWVEKVTLRDEILNLAERLSPAS